MMRTKRNRPNLSWPRTPFKFKERSYHPPLDDYKKEKKTDK